MTYDHRTGDPCSDFSYDTLDRLTLAEYGIQDNNEVFTIDDLGNRDNVNIRDGNDVNYVVDNLTNRYDSVDGNTLTYDSAGNLEIDKDAYKYYYDYENRIVKITRDPNDTVVAEFAYDALGRRIRKIDSIAGTTRLYFYNDKWQVLTETDVSETMKAWFAYGNYIDEVLLTAPIKVPMLTRCYVHDHLYSPAALTTASGTVQERYEYDAYGSPYVLEPNFANDPDGASDYTNPYYFTGRRVDFLDGGDLTLQHNRHRHYDYYTGRWVTQDPAGYVDGMNLYEYAMSGPVLIADPMGLMSRKEQAKAALSALLQIHTGAFGYRYSRVSGLTDLISGRLMPVLDQVSYGRPRAGRVASYDPARDRMAIGIDESDLTHIGTARVPGYMVFHEAIHAYNDKNRIVIGNDLFSVYKDEGIAYAAQYMAEASESLQLVEDLLNKGFQQGNKCPDMGKLRLNWVKAWQRINKVPARTGVLPDWVVSEWGRYMRTVPGLDRNEFYIGGISIARVNRFLGFKLSCSKIAEEYNNWTAGRLDCVEFTCFTSGTEPGEISLEGIDKPLYSIFR